MLGSYCRKTTYISRNTQIFHQVYGSTACSLRLYQRFHGKWWQQSNADVHCHYGIKIRKLVLCFVQHTYSLHNGGPCRSAYQQQVADGSRDKRRNGVRHIESESCWVSSSECGQVQLVVKSEPEIAKTLPNEFALIQPQAKSVRDEKTGFFLVKIIRNWKRIPHQKGISWRKVCIVNAYCRMHQRARLELIRAR